MISVQKCFILIIFIYFRHITATSLTEVTAGLFKGHVGDILAAFGDFNADKLTDIFVVCDEGRQIDVLLGNVEHVEMQRHTLVKPDMINGTDVITGVIPADYDGDVQMDLLVMTRKASAGQSDPLTVSVYWGDNNLIAVGLHPLVLEEQFKDQPLLFDWNADMYPDLLAESPNGTRQIWLASATSGERKFKKIPFPANPDGGDWPAFRRPHSNAFLDLDEDFTADMVISTEEGYEIWHNIDGTLKLNDTLALPVEGKVIGQSSFADLDQDSKPEHIVPVCSHIDSCEESSIYIHSGNEWYPVVDGFVDDHGNKWVFLTPKAIIDDNKLAFFFPITLRVGDFNMDGFPDTIAVLTMKDEKGDPLTKAFLLENVACSDCKGYKRTFRPLWDTEMIVHNGVALGAFYDLYENGIIDILLVTLQHDKSTSKYTPHLRALRNDLAEDACFVKVTVASGVCKADCPEAREPTGVNQPGASVKYHTTKTDGSTQTSCGAQLSQSAHFSLQMPFTIFGLGQTPNFVDQLSVGIPRPPEKEIRQKDWPMIIPNSHMLVIPFPNDEPSRWTLKLFMTPSHLVLITGAALIGTCGFIAGIVGALHWREKREDMKEKRQDAQKFHFDAM